MTKKYRGHRPKYGTLVAEHDEWELWELECSSDKWVSMKLLIGTGMAEKANYWIAWSPTEKRWSGTPDIDKLRAQRPDLLAFVETWLYERTGEQPKAATHLRPGEVIVVDTLGGRR